MTSSYFPIISILGLSIIAQTAAAIMAIRLVGITGRLVAWCLKGELLVSSEYGKGSRFPLEIPVRLP